MRSIEASRRPCVFRDERDVGRDAAEASRAATQRDNPLQRRDRSRPCPQGQNGGEPGTDATAIPFPLSCDDPGASMKALVRSNSSYGNTTGSPPASWRSGGSLHGIDIAPVETRPPGPELLALRRAGATVARLTRWLRIERNTVVAATTVGRWLDGAHARAIGQVPRRLRRGRCPGRIARPRTRAALPAPRCLVHRRIRLPHPAAESPGRHHRRMPPRATRRPRAARRPLDRVPLAAATPQWLDASARAAAGTSRATGSARVPAIRGSRRRPS